MNKRVVVFFVLLSVSVAVLCGASSFGRTATVAFIVDETTMEEEVKLPFFTVAKVAILYGGDYEEYCKKCHSGDAQECLRSLNADFYNDVLLLCERLSIDPIDAEAKITKEGFLYTDGIEGRTVDREKLWRDVLRAFKSGEKIKIAFSTVEPTVKKEDIVFRTQKISAYSTDYAKSAEGRKKNVRLACEKIDCAVVMPGEIFSFNKTVGERTTDNGFYSAKIIVDGAFTDGVGGGVCQVSTTLFDAWLQAGLSVERAAAHSLPVSYVPPSLDAMVSSSSDLLLVNDGRFPVYLRAHADGKTVKIEVYGAPGEYKVRLRSVTEKILPAEYEEIPLDLDWQEEENERVIKRAKEGRVSAAYRDYYDGDKLIKSEFLRRNVYKPQSGQKAIKKEN